MMDIIYNKLCNIEDIPFQEYYLRYILQVEDVMLEYEIKHVKSKAGLSIEKLVDMISTQTRQVMLYGQSDHN